MTWRVRALWCLAVIALSTPAVELFARATPPAQPPAVAASPAPQAPDATTPPPPLTVTPAQIERVQRALARRQSGLRLDEQQLRFYLEIIARQPSFAEYTRGYDFLNGPTRRGNPMTHQEFLDMVTPKEMYSSDLIPAIDRLQAAFTNWIGQSLIRRALEELKQAKDDREVQEIRERITRELDALTSAGKGKPPASRSTAE
ncbi:MAG: hypothetical protein IT184_05315 [Acidobacteria bacterium]|nr:hypothetical protein [Acidobacteriota bacterium]